MASACADASLSSAIPLVVDDGELKGKAKPDLAPPSSTSFFFEVPIDTQARRRTMYVLLNAEYRCKMSINFTAIMIFYFT